MLKKWRSGDMDYPFVHRGLLKDEISKITIEALKMKLVGSYVRNSGCEPLKIVDILDPNHFVSSSDRLKPYIVLKGRKGEERRYEERDIGTYELIDDPTKPW